PNGAEVHSMAVVEPTLRKGPEPRGCFTLDDLAGKGQILFPKGKVTFQSYLPAISTTDGKQAVHLGSIPVESGCFLAKGSKAFPRDRKDITRRLPQLLPSQCQECPAGQFANTHETVRKE